MKGPIVIVGAGTGGHVFPAISLVETLAERGKQTFILTDARALSYWPTTWKNIKVLPIQPLRAGFKGLLLFMISLVASFLLCCRLFWHIKPSIVVTFGGYPTIPALGAAILLRRPTILHEQNAVVGRVNYLFSRFAKYFAFSWPETWKLPAYSSLNMEMTGLPVRKAIAELHKHRYCPLQKNETLKILILGGSQGAQVFNALIPEAISLLPKNLQHRLEIFHQCRQETLLSVRAAYQKTDVNFDLQPFYGNIPKLLLTVNFVISRSGASTLGEIATAGLPAIFVPYKQAKDNHQTANALNFEKRGAAWVIPQEDFTTNRLKCMLEAALKNPEILLAASEALNPLKSHKANQKLAALILNTNLTLPNARKRTKIS
jgi:UDP-N-acetylglucosamine--N-acetylmuramyl-(pentapeptide) pyrophosphoryl-undecaprenol N-acetylglucosamine transferase